MTPPEALSFLQAHSESLRWQLQSPEGRAYKAKFDDAIAALKSLVPQRTEPNSYAIDNSTQR